MKKLGQFFTCLILSAFLVVGCSSSGTVTGSRPGTLVTNSQEKYDENSAGTTAISVSEIIDKYIPKPFSPVIYSDGLEFRGKWAGNVMPGLTQEMEKRNWTLYDGLGAKKFYTKDIDGHNVKISILPTERGGPEEKDATTFVKVDLVKGN